MLRLGAPFCTELTSAPVAIFRPGLFYERVHNVLSDIGAGRREGSANDADQLAFRLDERAARVPAIDRS